MKIRTIFYSIRQGFKNIRRHSFFSLAAVGTITVSLVLFGFFYFVTQNVEYIIDNLQSEIAISVFFNEDTDDEKISDIGDAIKAREEVMSVEYISPDEALEIYKKTYEQGEEFSETFKDFNPLENYDSYTVYLKDVSRQDELVEYIESLDGVRVVKSDKTVAKNFSLFNSVIGYICTGIIVLLIAVAIFLIANIISMGITVRAEEIEIMKNIGATNAFIRAPFMVEGFTIGFTGAVVPLLILYPLYSRVAEYVAGRYGKVLGGKLVFIPTHDIFIRLIPIMLGIGIGIGLIGTVFTLVRKLRR